MLFLDANALYYFYGNEKLGQPIPPNIDISKLRSICEKISDIALPSSAYMEMVVHFKDSPKTIKSIISFLAEKKVKTWNNIPTYDVSKDLLDLQTIFDTTKSTLLYINKITNAKMQCELAFSHFFLYEILTIYTYTSITSKKDIPQNEQLYALRFVYERLIKNNNNYRKLLQQAYEEGYEKNDPQRIVKNFFIDCIRDACLKIDILIEWVCEYYRQGKEVDISTIFDQAYAQATRYKRNNPEMSKVVKVISNTTINTQILFEELSEVFGQKFTKAQKEYQSQVLLSQWLFNGQQFQKNDIFDFFWIGCLDHVSAIPKITNCITFDKKMRKFIKAYRPYMDSFISSLIIS